MPLRQSLFPTVSDSLVPAGSASELVVPLTLDFESCITPMRGFIHSRVRAYKT